MGGRLGSCEEWREGKLWLGYIIRENCFSIKHMLVLNFPVATYGRDSYFVVCVLDPFVKGYVDVSMWYISRSTILFNWLHILILVNAIYKVLLKLKRNVGTLLRMIAFSDTVRCKIQLMFLVVHLISPGFDSKVGTIHNSILGICILWLSVFTVT